MTQSGKGKLTITPQGKCYIYVPTEVHRDSAFPWKPGSHVVDVHIIKSQQRLAVTRREGKAGNKPEVKD